MKNNALVSLVVAVLVTAIGSVAALSGCATAPPAAAEPRLQFVDLQSFDSRLAASLESPLPRVEVLFYDRVTPSQLPDRLQRWLAAVEKEGGKVSVTAPPSTVAAKSPFLLISALSAMWSAHKVLGEASQQVELRAARRFNAELVLKQDERGEVAVSRVVFVRRGA